MVVHKRLTSKDEKDVQSIGRTLQRLGGKLLGDARAAAFGATERTLATAQKRLQEMRTNLRGPRPRLGLFRFSGRIRSRNDAFAAQQS